MTLLDELVSRYPPLAGVRSGIEAAFTAIVACYEAGGKLLVCGNGGSAADSDHIVGELMKGFLEKRRITKEESDKILSSGFDDTGVLRKHIQRALPAISLTSHTALNTAFANDECADLIFAQQVYG